MYSTTMRYTGTSGVDTTAMVEAMMISESINYNRMYQQNQLTGWEQQCYRAMSGTLVTAQSSITSVTSPTSIRMESSFSTNVGTATINGDETDSVTVNSSSATGDHTVDVEQLAENDEYTSKPISGDLTGEQPMDVTELQAGDSVKVNVDGVVKTITFDQDDIDAITGGSGTPEKNFVDMFNEKLLTAFGEDPLNPGNNKVEASIDPSGNLHLEPGVGHSVTVTEVPKSQSVTAENELDLTTLSNNQQIDVTIGNETISVTYTDGMTNQQFVDALNAEVENNTTLAAGHVTFGLSSDNKLTVTAKDTESDTTVTGLQQLGFAADSATLEETNTLYKLGLETGDSSNLDMNQELSEFLEPSAFDANGNLEFELNGQSFSFDKSTTLQEAIDEINNSSTGVEITYSYQSQEFTVSGKETGGINAISYSSLTYNPAITTDPTLHTQQAQDCIFIWDGQDATSRPTNNVTVDGVNMTFNEVTPPNETVEIGITADASKSSETIHNFVTGYNAVVEELNKATMTPRPRTDGGYYMPLTPDQSAAMSSEDIELWNAKGQQGLLYGDPTLVKIQKDMRNAVMAPVTLSSGKTMSLYDIGISTSSAMGTDAGKLVIDEEKLAKALAENPEDVMEMFTKPGDGIGDRLDKVFEDAIGTEGTLTKKAGLPGTISETQNDLSKQMVKQEKALEAELRRLEEKEEYYYMMFAQMEASINQSNADMAYLQSQGM